MNLHWIRLFLLPIAINCLDDYAILKCDEFERNFEYIDMYCTVTNFHVTHSQQVKIYDYPFQRTNNTKFMKFYDSTLLYVPHKLFERFQNLKNLDISYSGIIEIPRNTFISGDSLSYLNASHNNISEISSSVFNGAPSLLRIDLSYNQIVKINENAFKGLTLLDRITLSGNQIKYLEKNIFIDNVYLEIITLDNNQLENLEPDVFSRLRRIRDIDLTNNNLLKIDPKTFQNAYNIETLLLSGNKLIEFNIEIKNQINRLQLDNNQLTKLIINSTKHVNANNNNISTLLNLTPGLLEKLYLSKNNFNYIQNITNLTNLLILDISYNRIGQVNITTFEKLKRLKELYLKNTKLSGINFGTFSKQVNLEILDISFNNLQYLNLDIFVPYMSKIKKFYIDGNNLTEIYGKMSLSYAFPNLMTVGLSQNNFNCTYLHNLLIPPYLSKFVELYIEPDAEINTTNLESKITETTHIRDISCISDSEYMKNEKNKNDGGRGKTNDDIVLQNTIQRLQIHERELESHLIMVKTFFAITSAILICGLAYNVYKISTEKRISLVRRIAYRSSATVDTSLDVQ